jgi:polysaccharide deacetylase family protein (PEP-CTERM system associated)
MITNALSIDVEEYYHGMEFEAAMPGGKRDSLPSRVEESVEKVLFLLAAHETTATFFTVGQVAQAHPEMVRRICKAGHEVACHSYRHELVYRQSPDEFRSDVHRAKAILEDLTGTAVVGYRAPNYSIQAEQQWAYDVLLEEGFQYDSSVYPIVHDRYGQAVAPRFVYEIRRSAERLLLEFPIGTVRIAGVNFPLGGGGYFRLFPEFLFHLGIRRVNEHDKHSVMFYFHPWELDPEQPRPLMPWHHRFRHYVGLSRQAAKLAQLFSHVQFKAVSEVLALLAAEKGLL